VATVTITLDRDSGDVFRSRNVVDGIVVWEAPKVTLPGDATFYVFAGAFTTSTNQGSVELWIDDLVVRVR